jgi:hypothetical protein
MPRNRLRFLRWKLTILGLSLLELLANHTGFAGLHNSVAHSFPAIVLAHGELRSSLSLVTKVYVIPFRGSLLELLGQVDLAITGD